MTKAEKAWFLAMDPKELRKIIGLMMDLLDDGDQDDFFGTEGWRHRMGWDADA